MQSWYFSEQSYAPAWDEPVSPKVTSPSNLVDPEVAHRLLSEYIVQCKLADELGMNIMTNEHHAAYTCMSVSSLMTLAVLNLRALHVKFQPGDFKCPLLGGARSGARCTAQEGRSDQL